MFSYLFFCSSVHADMIYIVVQQMHNQLCDNTLGVPLRSVVVGSAFSRSGKCVQA